jgi:predicted secreted acid phosphatase
MKTISAICQAILAITCLLFSSITAIAEPVNLGSVRKQIEQYHDSGAYLREITRLILCTEKLIHHKVKLNQHRLHPKKLAIVLDIDETSLSYYSQMVHRQFVATDAELHREIRAANSPAIKPTLELYQQAIKQKIAVFFITGRKELERAPTQKNLKRAGFTHWSGIYFKPMNYKNASTVPYKSGARAEITRKGYTIIANIGDQYSDLKGGYAETWTKLPNPFYYLP